MYIYIGIILSILYTRYMYGNIEPKKYPKIKLSINPILKDGHFRFFNYHLHHWILFLLLLVFLLSIKVSKEFNYNLIRLLIGFSLYMIIHGLQYEDAFDLKFTI